MWDFIQSRKKRSDALPLLQRDCVYCGKSFKYKAYLNRKYCTKSCCCASKKGIKYNCLPRKKKQYGGDFCKLCNVFFVRNRREQVFCGISCSNRHTSLQIKLNRTFYMQENKRSRRSRNTKICCVCNKVFPCNPSKKVTCCSRECSLKKRRDIKVCTACQEQYIEKKSRYSIRCPKCKEANRKGKVKARQMYRRICRISNFKKREKWKKLKDAWCVIRFSLFGYVSLRSFVLRNVVMNQGKDRF